MDHTDLEHVLKAFESEDDEVQRQIAVLQARSAALVKGAEGVRALLEARRELAPLPSSIVPPVSSAAVMADTPSTTDRLPGARAGEGQPKGKVAAKLILESDQSKFWTVRAVHDEQVRRGWTEFRPPGAPGNPPSRAALDRLRRECPENVEVQETPMLAYRWTSERLPSVNGSGPSHAEEA